MSEKYALSCMIQEPGKFIPRSASDGIAREAFYLPAHRLTFDHLKAHFQKYQSTDLTLFVQERSLDGTLDAIGGPSAMADLFTYAADGGGQWTHHAAHLREMKARRLAANAATLIGGASDGDEAIHEAKTALEAIQAALAGPRRSSTGKDAAENFCTALASAFNAGDYPGAESGFHELDGISGGMKPGELWVVCGKPSRGKSVILLQVASEFIKRGEPVAVFSLEMMETEIMGRIISCTGRVDYGTITQPRTLNKDSMSRIQTTAKTVAKSPLWIDASAGQSIETITAEATRIRDSNGCIALVVVDYLQLIRGGRNRNETREEEVARVSGGLKQLAKALKCTVLSASQLNESGQTRESRAIEQDADALLFICEDGVKVGKMRNGRRDALLPLFLEGRHQRFTERISK